MPRTFSNAKPGLWIQSQARTECDRSCRADVLQVAHVQLQDGKALLIETLPQVNFDAPQSFGLLFSLGNGKPRVLGGNYLYNES